LNIPITPVIIYPITFAIYNYVRKNKKQKTKNKKQKTKNKKQKTKNKNKILK
jgi:mannose/fructose/N-acetylgalactosamine-specific phosphotransferase system component IIC